MTYEEIGSKRKDDQQENISRVDFQFAFSTESLDERIAEWMELLENLEDRDLESAKLSIEDIYTLKRLLEELIAILPTVDVHVFNQLIEKEFAQLTSLERWKIYSFLRSSAIEKLEDKICAIQALHKQQENEMKDVETIENAEIIRGAHVVGITTTGAAKQRALLERLQSKIGKRSHF